MQSSEIRQTFFRFFESKGHRIVPSAPMVVKDDPTLMFTNAGMNQFKDFFLGNKVAEHSRVADTQKCLRVSGKHNDLEEVGLDGYHHTMFEMLGNWSFGDYFKKEAIAWAWELLTEVYQLDPDDLYVTIFYGDSTEGLEKDNEAADVWEKFLPSGRILYYGKKDNFWEMGDTGPCGPCSEIHIDTRSKEEKSKVPGNTLVNAGHPLVIELWNLVFIQYNRKSDGTLEGLPAKHVDTGMGFERLVRVLQNASSNYDTDLFTPLIGFLENRSGLEYTGDYSGKKGSDVAMRVVVDHIRAISFGIADGQMPSNTGAGYVLRRILRRAVRYVYTRLEIKDPVLYRMVSILAEIFSGIFPELSAQEKFIIKVIEEEEKAFLRTLEGGLERFIQLEAEGGKISGRDAFELYDTYGFPVDLTRLMATEKGWTVDEEGFKRALEEQRARSRKDATRSVGDWQVVREVDNPQFVGYDQLEVSDAKIVKFRTLQIKTKEQFQLVLDKTPFYPEGGGQVGDRGALEVDEEFIRVLDTVRENDLPIHIVDKLPKNLDATITARVDPQKRKFTTYNHSATHLLQAALRKVLGDHVQQKGSLLNEDYLRFDFEHFGSMTEEEIRMVEAIVNEKIREDITRQTEYIPIEQAKAEEAMMLFGEKYGEEVRMISFDKNYSVELCGGCHVPSTGHIGYFKITGESGIAAGVRRIVALTGPAAEEDVNGKIAELEKARERLKNPQDILSAIDNLIAENKELKRQNEALAGKQIRNMQKDLAKSAVKKNGFYYLNSIVQVPDGNALKKLASELLQDLDPAVVALGAEVEGKPQLVLSISRTLCSSNNWHAGQIVKNMARHIKGGGGGQPFLATAGGTDAAGIQAALAEADQVFKS